VAAGPYPHCDGDGTSGKRIQAVYAHTPGVTPPADPAGLIRQWSAEVDKVFDVSSRRSGAAGAFAHPRWVFTGACSDPGSQLSVLTVEIANPGGSLGAVRTALGDNGAGANPGTLLADYDRKYMVWMDLGGTSGCPGPVADFSPDTDPDPDTNVSNQKPGTGFNRAMIAVLCAGSWDDPPNPGLFNKGPQHELVHTLGGVNRAAPNSGGGHCWDFWDALCSDDTPPVGDGFVTDPDTGATIPVPPTMGSDVCSSSGSAEGVNNTVLLDCNSDDYLSMAPAAGSYLANNWNLATSCFLVTSGVTDPTPNPATCADDYTPPPPGGGPGTTPPPPASSGFDLAAALKKCKKKKSKRAKKKCKKKARQRAGL
jgi:hypothetical protein